MSDLIRVFSVNENDAITVRKGMKMRRITEFLSILTIFLCSFASAQVVSGTWSTHAAIPTPREQHVVAVAQGKLVTISGASDSGPTNIVEIYDPVTDVWTTGTSAPVTRGLAAVGTIDDQIYCVNGCLNSDCNFTTNQLYRYDIVTDSWNALTSATIQRGGAVAGVLNGKLYVAGGHTSGFTAGLDDLEIYDPVTDAWSMGSSMIQAVENPAAASAEGKFYVAGGWDRALGGPVDTLQIYDQATDTWSLGASLPIPLQVATGKFVCGYFFVAGGSSTGISDRLFAYDPVTDTWLEGPNMPTGRRTLAGAVINGRFYTVSGVSNAGKSAAVESFVPTIAQTVFPTTVSVTRGDHVSGGSVELANSDNLDLSVRRSLSDIQSRTEFEIQSVSPTEIPTVIQMTLEGAVFARSAVNQIVELYDYTIGGYEQVDMRSATRLTDSTILIETTGNLSRFVEPGTRLIKARVRYQSVNPRQRFSSNTDQFTWTIGL